MPRSPLLAATALLVLIGAPSALAVDGFVGCSTSDDAYAFDLVSYVTGPAIDLLPEGNYPYDATIAPDGDEVWFVGASGDGVVVLDRATSGVVARIPVADYVIGIAFSNDGSRAFVSSRGDENLSIIDTDTYTVVDTLPIPTGYLGAGNLALEPVSGKLYLVDWYGDLLYEIDAEGSTILRQRDFGTSLWQVVAAPDGEHVYVTDRGADQVVEIATDTFTMTRTFAVGDDPWGLDINNDGSRLVVSCEDSHDVHLIDLSTGASTVVPLDESADPRDVDILDDASLAFVAGGTATGYTSPVYVIDLLTDGVIDVVDGPGSNANVVAVQAQMHDDVTPAPTPAATVALRAWPNPFNPQLTVELRLDAPARATVTVHDLAGRRVRTLASGRLEAGAATFRWDGRDETGRALPSGAYLVSLRTGGASVTEKVVLME